MVLQTIISSGERVYLFRCVVFCAVLCVGVFVCWCLFGCSVALPCHVVSCLPFASLCWWCVVHTAVDNFLPHARTFCCGCCCKLRPLNSLLVFRLFFLVFFYGFASCTSSNYTKNMTTSFPCHLLQGKPMVTQSRAIVANFFK